MAKEKQKPGKISFPNQGVMFWPVGCGDNTTIVIDTKTILQIDLNHLEGADDDDDPRMAIIDHFVKMLPKKNGKPYLALFALTHPDQDHCRGFAELLKKVHIGELWFSPRIFRDHEEGTLSDDAKAFHKEAKRRVKKTIDNDGDVDSGDRVRIIGYDELLKEDDFKGFPKAGLTVPGHTVSIIDGDDRADQFSAFIHGPFKDDCDGERNDASLAMQITLKTGEETLKVLLFGDLCYPTLKKIFDISNENDPTTVDWNVLLTPHHCSKSAMFWKEEGEDEAKFKQDIMDAFEAARLAPNYIVASSECIPSSNDSGDNPPHAKAAKKYQLITDNFMCTGEHPDKDEPLPIIIELTADGIVYLEPEKKSKTSGVKEAVAVARGAAEPPRDSVRFG